MQAFGCYPDFAHYPIPGNFLEDVTDEGFGRHDNLPASSGDSLRFVRSNSHQSSRNSSDEAFFDYSMPSRIMATEMEVDTGVSSQMVPVVVEPLVEEASAFQHEDWKGYAPPPELFHVPSLPEESMFSVEIKQIIDQSVIRIHTRLREEQQTEATAASLEIPLIREVRALNKRCMLPLFLMISLTVLQISRPRAQNFSRPIPPSLRLSGASEESLESNDAGYGRTSPEVRLDTPRTKKSFGLKSIFKRKESKRFPAFTDPLTQSRTPVVPTVQPFTRPETSFGVTIRNLTVPTVAVPSPGPAPPVAESLIG